MMAIPDNFSLLFASYSKLSCPAEIDKSRKRKAIHKTYQWLCWRAFYKNTRKDRPQRFVHAASLFDVHINLNISAILSLSNYTPQTQQEPFSDETFSVTSDVFKTPMVGWIKKKIYSVPPYNPPQLCLVAFQPYMSFWKSYLHLSTARHLRHTRPHAASFLYPITYAPAEIAAVAQFEHACYLI